MIRIASCSIPNVPSDLWPLLKQVGVDEVVSLLDDGEQAMRWLRSASHTDDRRARSDALAAGTEHSWSRPALERLKARYEEAGFSLVAIEDTPPMDDIRLGRPGTRGAARPLLRAAPGHGSSRRAGALLQLDRGLQLGKDRDRRPCPRRRARHRVRPRGDEVARRARPEADAATEERLWENFEYFLRRVVPVAEEADVRLALHPDDPPISPVRGLGRIMRSVEAFERVVELVPSDHNGITLCQGNFALMTDDLPGVIRDFGSRGKIHFVHFRDVRGTPEHFVETFHDDGPTDMLACLEAYADVGYEGVLRPDHVPTLHGESNDRPGLRLPRTAASPSATSTGLREAVYAGR